MRKPLLTFSFVFCCTFYVSNAQESLTAQLKSIESSAPKKSDKEKLDLLSKIYFEYQLKSYPELSTFYGIKGDNTRWTDLSKEAISQRKTDNTLLVESINKINRAALEKADRLNFDLLKTKLEENKAAGQFTGELMPIDKMNGQHQNMVQVIAFTNIKSERMSWI